MRFLIFSFCLLGFGFNAEAETRVPRGQNVLWSQNQQPVGRLDLFWGSGGEGNRPRGPFKFVSENTSGTNPKVWVTDPHGVRWSVKFDEEVHSEVAASRLFWAAGYRTDHVYFVPAGVIEGARGLQRAAGFIKSGGRFKNARFETNPAGREITRLENYDTKWKWEENPFLGTKELSGLKIMNALVANFDTKSSNNSVQHVRYSNGAAINWYMVSDLGGTFGSANASDHSKWKLQDFVRDPFVGQVSGRQLILLFGGKNSEHFQSVPVEHARWIYDQIGRLDRRQIEDAFRAALTDDRKARLSATDESLVEAYTQAVEKRIRSLGRALGL